MRCVAILIAAVLAVGTGRVAAADEGWNYIGQWDGDRTVDFDTRTSRYRQFVTGLTRRALLIHGVSVVVTSGSCDFEIEAGYTFDRIGNGLWRADERFGASKSIGGKGVLAVIPPPLKLMGFDPVRVNMFRTDSKNTHCQYRVYQRYRTLSHALLQAQFVGALDIMAYDALRSIVPKEAARTNQYDGGVIVAMTVANAAIENFLRSKLTADMMPAGEFTLEMRLGINQSVNEVISRVIGMPVPRSLENYVTVISAMTRDIFWSLYGEPIKHMAR